MKNFDEMNRLFREMDRMFDVWSGWYDEYDAESPGESRRAFDPRWIGRGSDDGSVLEREGDEYVFVMDLPGFEREEIDLRFDDGVLSVRARKDVDEADDRLHTVRSRRVEKSVRIPADVSLEECAASYHNGVLEVHLPIEADEEGGHRIDID